MKARGRPRRFPNGTVMVAMNVPPEVAAEFRARGGREWLFKALGFDFGPKQKTPSHVKPKEYAAPPNKLAGLYAAFHGGPRSAP